MVNHLGKSEREKRSLKIDWLFEMKNEWFFLTGRSVKKVLNDFVIYNLKYKINFGHYKLVNSLYIWLEYLSITHNRSNKSSKTHSWKKGVSKPSTCNIYKYTEN